LFGGEEEGGDVRRMSHFLMVAMTSSTEESAIVTWRIDKEVFPVVTRRGRTGGHVSSLESVSSGLKGEV
jgi:hypothetical protein